jgi:O-acetyl-ADP-ribose deacetylase (regulator of RNase III)
MITYVKGDLLASDCKVLVHGCNCFCTFGAGIALQIKQQFPSVYEADCYTRRGDVQKLGTMQPVPVVGGRLWIVNLYSQYDCGGGGPGAVYADYLAIERGMTSFCSWLLAARRVWPKVGMPRIGCGLAGGDWHVVEAILDSVFGDLPIFVYDFTPGRR